MKLKKKALLYDIANIAYVIADTGDTSHALHRVQDICQDGNIHRVARILGLAYSRILDVLAPVLNPLTIDICRDASASPHDYIIDFSDSPSLKFSLTPEKRLRIKETAHEYMVAMVLYDWLSITLPPAADVWKFKMTEALASLRDSVGEISSSSSCSFRRKLNPF